MSDLQKRLDNLSPEKRELLLKKLQTQKQTSSTSNVKKIPPIESASRDQAIPLSFAQQRLWFLDQLEPNTNFYNISSFVRLEGELKVLALEQSLSEIIRRHEALRTNFITTDGQAVQLIHPVLSWTLPVIDLQHLPESEREISWQRLANIESQRPFDLAQEALVRATLLILENTEHILLLTIHHIVFDGWSMGVFFQELAALYCAFCTHQPSPLKELPIQYADFTVWQRQWMQGDVFESQLAYWRQQLAGVPALLELPTDRPRPAVQSFRGTYQSYPLKSELTQALNLLSNREGVTLFMLLLAGFNILLYRYTQQSDILVGSPIANRNHSQIEGLIGFFVNTLVLRTDVSGDPSFLELLKQVREMTMDAYAHQDLPFELLVEALQPKRNLSHTPLFQVMLILQNAPMSEVEFSGLTLSPLNIESKTAKFDLTLSIDYSDQELVASWEYNTDLFDASTIERMAGHFEILLEGIVANPEQRLSQLPLLTPSERHQLLFEWNDTQIDYPQDKCIHQLFESQVGRTPDAVAVEFEEQQLTYLELNALANQLASYLQTLGIGPDVLVGICVERSNEMIVALLAVFKAGGAYVPIDPDYPQHRLSFMLSDSQLPVLLTQQGLVERIPNHQAIVVCLDQVWQHIAQHHAENPVSGVSAGDLANVIYTSGSTGTPKGVMVSHSGLCNLALAQIQMFELLASSRILQFASLSFDASISEIVMALVSGARLYLGTKDSLLPSVGLIQLIRDYGITHITLPPSALAVMPVEELLTLQTIIVAGESCAVDLMRQWSVGRRFFNAYGPTEATVCATVTQCRDSDSTLVIGRPIANTQVYILDSYLQPVPVGVVGELHISGVGLALGYLNRPELTVEKFIPNPFSNDPQARLYKTGDLARYLSDGNIEYLGRIDHQVKIRGFRIELGEIEALLSQHPSVLQTVVIAREDVPGNKRLVAYLVCQQEQAPTINDLRQFLKEKLPEYMVPSAFILLEALPLTPNGKVDRRALPVPEFRPELEVSFVAPRTPTEEMLASIWAGVLGVEGVGIHDNFFELGGDSILSLQIIARANQAGLQLTPKQLFGNQTIAELATVAGTTQTLLAEQGLVSGEMPLTPIQHWFQEQNLVEAHHFNQSVLLSMPVGVKPELLERVMQQLLVHHDALRLRFVYSDSHWQQIHTAPSDQVPFSFIDLSKLPLFEQTTAIEAIANQLQACLNLSQRLVQVALFSLGIDKPSRLLMVIHHLVVDGVSWRILLEDLHTGYQQLCQGKAIELPPKTTSFKDWALRLNEYAQSDALESELGYWQAQQRKQIAPIPVDDANGANTVASASTVSVSLSVAQTRALLQEVPKAYNTQINDVLLSALVQVLSKWTGCECVLLHLEGHGREDIFDGVDLSRTIGWFTTIFPVLLELEATDNPGEILKSIKEQLRHIPNKGIGYGLWRYLSEKREITSTLDTSFAPQISFNYLGQFDQTLSTSSEFQLAPESSGVEQSLLGQRIHLLDISGIILSEKLELNWTYSQNVHQQTTIEHLAQEFVEALRTLIAHCLSPEAFGYTPTDFPLASLNQRQLDLALAHLEWPEVIGTRKWQNLEDIYPLSPMQQGILFHSVYAPESGVYFEQLSCTFEGQLLLTAFELAWQQVVERHSVLRTAFIWQHLEQPLQVVYRQVKLGLELQDWRELSPVDQQQQLEVFLQTDRQRGFQFSEAPLMRLSLIQLDEQVYQFVWSHHHLLLDGWSLPLVLKELLEYYEAYCSGQNFHPQPTVAYRNYIAWLEQQDLAQAESFWRQKLQGIAAPTPLRVDKPLTNQQQHHNYSEQQIQLTLEGTTALQSFARQHQLTLNNLVQGAWALLLGRYSGEPEVMFGVTVSGRPPSLAGVESMVGLFINTLPLRVSVNSELELLPWLKDLQAQLIECEQYSYSALVDIQGWSEVPRGMPLFDSIVVFENYPVDESLQQDNSSLEISDVRGIERTNYPLTVVAIPSSQLSVKISYDTSRFDAAIITRMLGHLEVLLEGMVVTPQQCLSQLPLLTTSEQHQLLFEWNETHTDYPQDQCIHQLFELQVERTPDVVAVVFENQQLTYSELNARANQLAHYLLSLGVKPDVLVGICTERSLEMMVGLLGILKAGGAYVPLDPSYPQERLSFMLSDAQVKVLLTQQRLVEMLPKHEAAVVCIDGDWQTINQGIQENPVSGVTTDNLVYVIYTSGSTGKPKGVAVPHRAVNRLVFNTNYVQLEADDRVAQAASAAFDAATFEIWGALVHGARLVVISQDVVLSPQEFAAKICTQEISVLFLTTALFNQLASLVPETFNCLRYLLFGGEAVDPRWVKEVLQKGGPQRLLHVYGPTECTTFSSWYWVQNVPATALTISIGRPLSNTQIYLLDQNLQPVPIGVPGELHIAGPGLACGYLNRPELTQQKFIPNPFSNDQNQRLYKTGDLGRYLTDGNIEYLGRIDEQVKIRGFRIELGEIEAVLSQHPSVRQTVVIAREDLPGNKRLVAYFVPEPEQAPTMSELRQFLKEKLPEYMVPSAFVLKEVLPLTNNGKVDRRALPVPESRSQLEVGFVGARTPTEEMLANIWAGVLGVERVGIHDNFFELGGDSILSLQIIARANQAGLQLTPKQLFENQTIAELAIVAGTTQTLLAEQGLVSGEMPLTPIQHWFQEQNLVEAHHFNQSVLLSMAVGVKPELLERVVQQLLVHHDALRLRFVYSDSHWQQIHAAPSDQVPFSFIDLSKLPLFEQTTAIEAIANQLQASLNLSQTLVRVAFFSLGIDKPSRLLMVIHHLVVDGVSWRILLEDLHTGYQQLCQGKAIELPPKTTSFKDWALRLNEYAQSDALESELGYWQAQQRKQIAPIPVDDANGANTVASASTISVSLSVAQTRALLQEVPKAYNTQINDVLLSALVQVLSKWSGCECVLLHLEGHGREDIFDGVDLSRTIGWFTTIFPVLLELEATDNPGEILKSIKEQLRHIPNKGIGYGLWRYLREKTEVAAKVDTCFTAQISFNYLGQFDQTLSTSSGFQLAPESSGVEQSLLPQRIHLLDINAMIISEKLELNWTYSQNVHQHDTIDHLAQEFLAALRTLIAHCLSPEAFGYTPTDFPLASLNQRQLDLTLAHLEWPEVIGTRKWQNLEDIYPLSPMQQGMLFHSLYTPESGVYFEQLSCTLEGQLQVAAFELAWQQVVERHSILRTAFIWQHHHQPLQVVYRQVKLGLELQDWRELSPVEQQQQLEVFLQSERQRSLQLSQAPLMRLSLIQLDAQVYQFVWSFHHLLLDGWSLPLVFKELLECYEAYCRGQNFSAQPTVAYRNYIAWLQQQDLAQAESFWRQKLQGITAPTPLRVDKPLTNQQQQHENYSEQHIELTVQVTSALQSFARQHQLTLNNLVQGAWALLLGHYSGESEVLFGVTVSGRPPSLAGVESIVGLFINTLPLRVSVNNELELLPWLKDLQAKLIECEQYSYSALVDIQSWSQVPRGMPLFHSIVVFENYPIDESLQQENNSLEISEVRSIEQTNYPLTVTSVPGSQLSLSIGYDTSRFDGATITRMLGHLEVLLEAMVASSQQCLSQLPLLTASERHQLLFEWNDTYTDYPQDKCIHQLFESQVERTPDAVAVVFEDQQLTYGELNARANQLAHYLLSLGVELDALVGLYLERSLEMVVGVLGILKAGGAYVPLDPSYPQERLSFMLLDAQVKVLLTQQRLVEGLPQEHGAVVVCVDTDWQVLSEFAQTNSLTGVTSFHLAYVIYTSGSTGLPKGVMIPHQSLVNFTLAAIVEYGIDSRQRLLQFASISFDVAAEEIYPCLISGATLVLRTNQMLDSVPAFVQKCRDWQLTVLDLPTAYWHQITLELASSNLLLPHSIRLVIIGGEQASSAQLRIWQQHVGAHPELVNAYGPTEATVEATLYNLSNSITAEIDRQPIPIGRPIHNLQVYILDQNLQPVPVGLPGELHIAGAGLARGYLNRPELTVEKFIPNPFSHHPHARLYKTGDLARHLTDGNIEYLGRIDDQVKIRGFRIELGEIEAVLSQHPSVQQTVVIAREDFPGNKRLVAYLVCEQEQAPTMSELRQCLKEKLPEYMVPSLFVFLEALPLTPNGKVDRRALPVPESRPELEVGFVAPRTPTEEMLARIWADVLGVERVGRDNNFFELGGDSILSLQIIARANQAGLQLTPKQLFGNQTIAELATVTGTTQTIQAEQGLVSGALPLTPIQHWFKEQNLLEAHHFNQSVLLEVPVGVKPELLERVVHQLLLHHDALRLRFVYSDSDWQQIHAAPSDRVPFSLIDLSTLPLFEQTTAIEATATQLQASLNLSETLVRVAFLSLGLDKPSRLLIVIHHLVVDGVSWRILLEDLHTGYEQLCQGKAIELPAKTTSFKDWALRLNEYAQSDALESELGYWLTQQSQQIAPIPVDNANGANTVASVRAISVSLSEAQTRALLQEVPKAYNTQINDVLLSALVQVLARWTGCNSVLINLEGHGREDIFDNVDLSRTIGWFTTIFPVLLELEATDNLGEILKSIKEQLRQIPNKGIGYGLWRYLSENTEVAANVGISTPAQISFNYLGQFDQTLDTSSEFQLAPESRGVEQSLLDNSIHLVDINGIIANEKLQLNWTYSQNIHHHSTIEHLAQEFLEALRALIAHCLSPEAFGYTPTDFPLAKLNQRQLDLTLAYLEWPEVMGKTNWQNLEDIYPLSPMQQGMLFHSVYTPDSGVYVEQLSCTLEGQLQVAAFEQAWQQVVERHSVLRTAFIWQHVEHPLQVVYRQVKLGIELQDWRELSSVEQQQQLEVLLHCDIQRGFQLSQAPLMRLSLIQLDSQVYQFVWSHHHLLLDGWSLPLVFKELLECYEAYCSGQNFHAQPNVAYRNYIAWLQQQDLAQAESFWRQKLQGITAPTPLKVDKPLTNRQQQHNYITQQIQLTVQTTEALQSFARQHQLTLNNLVQGAWALLVGRYSGESEVVFGVTVSGRPPSLVGVESMVGLFINTLPLRVSVKSELELLPWLKELQALLVECEQYSYSALMDIQRWSEVPRGMPLFDSILVFENYPVDESLQQDSSSIEISDFHAVEQTNYPLTVVAIPSSQLSVKISYDTSRFEAATITRMLGHLEVLLEAMVVSFQQCLSQLPLLTPCERHQLLWEWNDTHIDFSQDQCIHQLFESQVEGTPDAVAVVFEDQQLTYSELNGRANQLAHYLLSLGVKPDLLVGLCVERSLEMVVGILGILKASGAYVPLDCQLPQQRLAFILEDAQITLLLTQQQLVENLPEYHGQILCIDSHWGIIAQHKQDNPPSIATQQNLAYTIYTSGSTGLPKGVLINHANVVRLFAATQNWFEFEQQDVWTLFHSFAFDFSVWEIWGALIYGGRLIVVPYWVSRSPKKFYELVCLEQVTVLNQTPSAFQQLSLVEQTMTSWGNLVVRWVIFGGEALEIQSLKPWFGRHCDSSPKLVNMYGITETTVHVTYRPITAEDLLWSSGSVIGCPIPDLQVYILDQRQQLLPIGVPGEIYVGGAGLASGYLNRPELTQQRFIPNPFSHDQKARLYKTGDLGRYLTDGNIEYLGRIDEQVKIRGFRIELGEIEAVLSQHPSVRQTVVIAREDVPGNKRLVAYLVCEQQQAPTITDLRQFLKEKLPEYMVPSAFVLKEALPLTNNGKVDRRALPVPESRSQLEVGFVGARTPTEEMLANIWAGVLGVERVGIHDNFFELGGDSILSLQIIARANQAGLQLTPKQLFENQTIAELAIVAGTTQTLLAEQGLVSGEMPLTPIQHWFQEQNLVEAHHFNQSVLLSVPVGVKPELLERVMQQLLLHHDALRLRFVYSDSHWQQIHTAPSDQVPFSFIDLSKLPLFEQTTAIEAIANQLQASLNLSQTLVRVAFFSLGIDKPSRLLMVIHHLVVDGVSWRILLEDLHTGYQQLCQGKAIELPPKTTSFKDWALRLNEYAQSDALESELGYWQAQQRKQIAPIPVDDANGANTVASASTISVSLSVAQTRALLQEVPKAYNTQINDVLLSALVQVLSKWSGCECVLLHLEGHGREDIFDGVDLSRTIGWFTTIFPVLLELEATDNPGEILKSIKEQLRHIPNKGIGYGLWRYLREKTEVAAKVDTCFTAQISFNYLGQFDQTLSTSSGFQLAPESSGVEQSLLPQRIHLLDINAMIISEKLELNWTYSQNVHQHDTIDHLAQEFLAALRTLIAHCLSPEAFGYTPTDFPLASLNQRQLDLTLAHLEWPEVIGTRKWQNLEDIYPLSPMQQGMLFHSLYTPESGVYFEQLSCTLEGQLQVAAFELAWQQVVERHSILRTAFIWQHHHQPLQVVYRQVKLGLELQDWRELSPVEQQQQLEVFLQSEQKQGFQLSQAPLMRLHLFQLDTNCYQFVWSHHHLLLDGWSLPLVFKQVLECYEAYCTDTNVHYKAIPAYRNYIAWLQQQDLTQAESFWRQKLQGITAPTSLKVDRPLTNRQQDENYSEEQIHLTPEGTEALQSFARQHQLTLNNLVQGAWALLLGRYSGEPEVVFGVTVSGRPPSLVGMESMVGLFINTLPLRVSVNSELELLPWVKDLQAQLIECEQYSYSALVDIQGWSEVPRGMPLFNSIVVFENYPIDESLQQENNSLEISDVRLSEQTNYPLTVEITPGSQLSLGISYDTSRFDAATITRMLGHLEVLLEAIVATPQQRLSQLPLLTGSERHQLLFEWNDTQREYPRNKCIHQLFEEQVERSPDAVALVFENQQITYRELNCRANQLAHYVKTLGVGANVLVGICLERSLGIIVGLLGVLKAGGAYVPLDPNYPQERLAQMLDNSEMPLLLTTKKLVAQLPQHSAVLVCLDTDWEVISTHCEKNPSTQVIPENLAYVIYTSGSTGTPKGVMVSHGSLVNAYWGWEEAYQLLARTSSHLQMANFSFDVFSGDMARALCSGAKLVICQRELLLAPEQLYRLMQEQLVDFAEFVPAVIRNLIEYLQRTGQNLQFMGVLVVGSDSWYVKEYEQFQRFCGVETRLINSYGVSEATIDSCYFESAQVNLCVDQLVPIGRPFGNIEIYILDSQLQPLPIGVPGELHIGGAGLADGYLNRPDLTPDKFIPHPFNNQSKSRLYKTGDLARYLTDGNIEFLGRIDNQVKIRGFRIELAEIEALISQHTAVLQTVVIVREDIPGDKRLVAYLVPHQESALTTSDLRRFLKQKLPEYMLPSAFVILEAMPLTPNGKVDRRALSAFSINSLSVDASFVPPLDIVEQQLAEIWTEILNVYPVGVKDNFFDLGGHSLLALQLMARIEQQFQKNLPLATLFEYSTIEQLATILRQPTDTLSWSALVPIQPNGSKRPFFCVPGGGGNAIYFYQLAHYLGREQPFYGLQSLGLDGKSKPHTRVEDMAAYYIEAIQSVQPQGPYFLGGHSVGGLVAFEMAQQLQNLGYEVALLALLDVGAPVAEIDQQLVDLDDAKWLLAFATLFEEFYGKNLELSYEVVTSLTPEEQLKYLKEKLQMVNLLPPHIGINQLRTLLEVYKANMQVVYLPQEVYPNQITYFICRETEDVSSEISESLKDIRLGWEKFSAKPLDISTVPGTHITMLSEPHVQVLAEMLRTYLE